MEHYCFVELSAILQLAVALRSQQLAMEICGQTDLYAKEGDLVILYETFDSLVHVRLTEDGFYDNKHGTFRHIDMIGQLFGSRVLSRKGNKFIYMLKPTPELWTLSLPHRTQILYNSDISYVLMALDVKPGHIVIESGSHFRKSNQSNV